MKKIVLICLALLVILMNAACSIIEKKPNKNSDEPPTVSINQSAPTEPAPTATEPPAVPEQTIPLKTEPITTAAPEASSETAPLTEPAVSEIPPITETTAAVETNAPPETVAPPETTPAPQNCTITLKIDFEENLFFSRYAVDLKTDGTTIKTRAHGVDDVVVFSLPAGTHTLTFAKNGDSSVRGETTVLIGEDTTLHYKIACFNDKVTVEIKNGSSGTSSGEKPSEAPPTEAPPEARYGINDSVMLENLEFTVLSIYDTKVLSYYFDDAKTDNNFVVLSVKITNHGTSEEYVSDSVFTYHVGPSKYNTSSSAIYLDSGLWLGESVGAGLSKTVNVVFEIPSEHTADDYLSLKISFFGDTVNIIMDHVN